MITFTYIFLLWVPGMMLKLFLCVNAVKFIEYFDSIYVSIIARVPISSSRGLKVNPQSRCRLWFLSEGIKRKDILTLWFPSLFLMLFYIVFLSLSRNVPYFLFKLFTVGLEINKAKKWLTQLANKINLQ